MMLSVVGIDCPANAQLEFLYPLQFANFDACDLLDEAQDTGVIVSTVTIDY